MTTYSLLALAVFGSAAFALLALAALHVLKPDIHPARTMISQYALGQYGWMMTIFFGGLAASSGCLFVTLMPHMSSLLGRTGLALLLAAAVGLGMAARFPMDPISTPPTQMSFSGRMHGVAFMIGVPCQLLAVLLLSLVLAKQASKVSLLLLVLAGVIWLSIAVVITIMLIVGPGKQPNPDGPERFLGWPNRLFMIAYGVWLMVACWSMAQ